MRWRPDTRMPADNDGLILHLWIFAETKSPARSAVLPLIQRVRRLIESAGRRCPLMDIESQPLCSTRSPLRWYGGKDRLAKRIVSWFPPHSIYVEPFFGGGSVLFRKPRSAIEIASDLYADLTAFWRIIQHEADYRTLSNALLSTRNSQVEYDRCRRNFESCTERIERIRQFFVLTQASFNGAFAAGWSRPSRPADRRVFHNKIHRFPAANLRLRDVQIMNAHFCDVIPMYNAPEVLIYCDPPYRHEVRGAKDRHMHEMSDADHLALLDLLTTTKSMVLLSGYDDGSLYRDELRDWKRLEFTVPRHATRGTGTPKSKATESLWINPRCWAAIQWKESSPNETSTLDQAA